MLIEAYEVRIFRCAACGGPVQAGARGMAPSCPFCGADTTGAIEAGAFSHDVRVLACRGCAAPLGVPVGGGRVQCSFCHTTLEIVARRQRPLGSGGSVDDPERLARLRAQDRPLNLLGPKLGRLMRRGSLVDETADEAEEMWKNNRSELRAIPLESRGEDARTKALEKEQFYLTELLADYYNAKQRRLVARGFLEAALEDLGDRRYLQQLYGWIARNAEKVGDSESADAWLALCDPCPDDLEMDSAVRFTWASMAIRRSDYRGVLGALGEAHGAVPLHSKFDDICDLFRAQALEKLEGPDAAIAHLRRSYDHRAPVMKRRNWLNVMDMVEYSPELGLCRESLAPAVRQAYPWFPRPILAVVSFVLFELALWTDVILGPQLFGERVLSYGAIPIGILGTLYLWVYVSVTFGATRKVRRRLEQVEANRPPPLAGSGVSAV